MMTESGEDSRRIVVVDDDRAIRTFMAETLRGAGHDVVEAESAEQALALLDGAALVVLDNHMPGITGIDLVRRLRAELTTRTLPVILVTADDEVHDRIAGLSAGADDYVIKPFSPTELLARVEARLRERSAWDAVVSAHLDERAAVARVLRAAAAEGSLDDRATALCDAFCELGSVGSAAIVVFEEDAATIIATSGDERWSAAPGDALPPTDSRYLAMRAAVGPWIDGLDPAPASCLLTEGRAACAPLGTRDRLSGLLVLAPRVADTATVNAVLAAGIDFATMTEGLLRRDLSLRTASRRRRQEIEGVLRDRTFVAHFQPIVDLRDEALPVVGVEALTRFADGVAPESRFRFAAAIGLGHDLERVTIERALHDATSLATGAWISINVSPSYLLADNQLAELLDASERTVVLELSEQEQVDDYVELQQRVRSLGSKVRLSVDDAGSGFASLRHILLLEPEYVKLDRTWVHEVDADPARQALIAGLVHFSRQTGSNLIAEGIETDAERTCLEELGVDYGQGFLLGEPAAAR